MKLLTTFFVLVTFSSLAQNIPYSTPEPYIRLIAGPQNPSAKRLELSKAIFYGSLRLTNALTPGSIGKEDLRETEVAADAEKEYAEDAKHVNFQELKTGGNGTIFYDKDNHILVIKIDGQWMKVSVEPLPTNVKYPF